MNEQKKYASKDAAHSYNVEWWKTEKRTHTLDSIYKMFKNKQN